MVLGGGRADQRGDVGELLDPADAVAGAPDVLVGQQRRLLEGVRGAPASGVGDRLGEHIGRQPRERRRLLDVVGPGRQQRGLVRVRGGALGRGDEARPHVRQVGAGDDRGGECGAVGDAAGEYDRAVEPLPDGAVYASGFSQPVCPPAPALSRIRPSTPAAIARSA